MKSVCFMIVLLSALTSFGQHAKNTLAMTVSGTDRVSVVKSSVRLAEWHEKSFWPLYDKYLQEANKVYSMTYRSLKDLASTKKNSDEQEAFENGWNVLTHRNEELELRKKYYQEVGAILNGVVALQFLQTEAMMDMLETAQIYNQNGWQKYRYHAASMPKDKVREGKHNMMKLALSLPAEKQELFWTLYNKYEEESDALLGESYNVYGLFASDAADFTPALAKRLGHDLLQVMEREVRLKERYFLEINAIVGSIPAARFLAWEDYYSVVCKMYAWAETP